MRRGESKSLHIAYNLGGPDAVTDAAAAARTFAAATGLDGDATARLAIIVEELVANLFDHGGVEHDQFVELTLSRTDGDVSLTLEDPGHAFNPAAPRAPADIPERGGGAGLDLVATWARILRYESGGGVNRLELVVPVARPPSEAEGRS